MVQITPIEITKMISCAKGTPPSAERDNGGAEREPAAEDAPVDRARAPGFPI